MIFVIMLIFAVACALIANSKGRSAVGWFFIGMFITWIGLIIVLVLPNENERQRREGAVRADTRRLREQLRQERMKNEAYRRHAASRLDLHDRALGMDTRQGSALPAGHGLQQPLLSDPASGESDSDEQDFIFAQDEPRAEAVGLGALGPDKVSTPPPPPVSAPAVWHYEHGSTSHGPVSAAAIRHLLARGQLDGTALVWREGMADWRPVSEVPQFSASFLG